MSNASPPAATQAKIRHSLFEDVLAILTGTLVVALGIAMFKKAGLVTGGVTGMVFLMHYTTHINFGVMLVAINLPFYAFALKKMGLPFTAKSIISVALVAFFTEFSPLVIRIEWLHPIFAGIVGGLLIGVGMLILFRHKASLGGLNILVLYLQEAKGWRAGHIQMAFDCAIVVASAFIVSPQLLAISVIGAVVLNLSLATNHVPGRYATP